MADNPTTVKLGMLPVNRGSYTTDTWPQNIVIYKDNIVQFNGSSYIYLPDDFNLDNPAASATSRKPYDSVPSQLNDYWQVFADGNNQFTTGQTVTNLGIDSAPTDSSTNLVTSGGVKSAIDDAVENSALRYDEAQTLTDAQKSQALANVGISGIDSTPTAGSKNLVTSGGVSKYLAKETARAEEPEYTLGEITDAGSTSPSQQYAHIAPITLKPMQRITLNLGEEFYCGSHTAVIYSCDSNGDWLSTIFSRAPGVSMVVEYQNTSDDEIKIGICGYKTQLGYIIERIVEAASASSVEEEKSNAILGWITGEAFTLSASATYTNGIIDSPVSIVWPDGVAGTLTITRNGDNLVTSIVATYGDDTYTYTITRDSDGNATASVITKEV